MTERLYYKDTSLLEFDATIVETGKYEEQNYTVLDRSAFYPTSGGQLFDTGTLNDVLIQEVIENTNGDVWHLSETAVGEVGDNVHGTVHRSRRLLNSQKHTAQHILSHGFYRLYNYGTVSVHLGEEYAAVELNVASIPDEQVAKVEQMALDIIEENVPVEILFVGETEIEKIPLRRPPKRSGTLRIINIGGFEYSACGGTHCQTTGQIGILKIIGTEKMRGHTLVKYHVGRQAWEDYTQRVQVTTELSHHFSCHVKDIVENVFKLTDENKTLQQFNKRLQKELIPILVNTKATEFETVGSHSIVCTHVDILDAKHTAKLVGELAEKVRGMAIVLAGSRLFVAVAENSSLHAGMIVKQFVQQHNLRGGGNKSLAQVGDVGAMTIREIKDYFKQMINAE